jgi:hypothetical protein
MIFIIITYFNVILTDYLFYDFIEADEAVDHQKRNVGKVLEFLSFIYKK